MTAHWENVRFFIDQKFREIRDFIIRKSEYMRIGGYQKLTLQDYPGYIAAICFTIGCQLRCPFCHNPELVIDDKPHKISNEENTSMFIDYLEKRRALLDGVVITGGEPLLQDDIELFIKKIKALNLKVKLDTNGLLPGKLSALIEQRLIDYVALDYKNHAGLWNDSVGIIAPRLKIDESFTSWQTSLRLLRQGNVPYEIRTTVVKELHSIDDLQAMANSLSAGQQEADEVWFLQRFKKSDVLLQDRLPIDQQRKLSAYSLDDMQLIQQKLSKIIPSVRLR